MTPSELLKEIEKLVNKALSIQERRRDRFRLRRWNSVKRTAARLELTDAHVRTALQREGKLVGKKDRVRARKANGTSREHLSSRLRAEAGMPSRTPTRWLAS